MQQFADKIFLSFLVVFQYKHYSYIVERKDTSTGLWEECAKTRYCYITVEGLKPSHSYEFRISAENKHGISEPCEPTAPILIPEQRRRRQGYDGNQNNVLFNFDSLKMCDITAFFLVDETGKIVRGKGVPLDNYDSYVIDIWQQYYPQQVEPKKASVYDLYDVYEEIGAYVFFLKKIASVCSSDQLGISKIKR